MAQHKLHNCKLLTGPAHCGLQRHLNALPAVTEQPDASTRQAHRERLHSENALVYFFAYEFFRQIFDVGLLAHTTFLTPDGACIT